jgi:DNA transformation protein
VAVSQSFLDFLLEHLEPLGDVSARRMFGGVGVYRGDVFFAIVDNDTVFFKVDDASAEAYKDAGMPPFRPYPDRPEASMGYFQVPAGVLEDRNELVRWAERAVEVGRSNRRKRRKKRGRNARRPGSV